MAKSRLAVLPAEEPPLAATRRWELSDLDDWLALRLMYQWGGRQDFWRGKLAGFVSSNAHLFVTNGDAVVLATVMPHPMSGLPVVMEIFAFARDAEESQLGEHEVVCESQGYFALRELYRYLVEWGKSMNATRRYVGICSDLLPEMVKDIEPEGYYIVGVPC